MFQYVLILEALFERKRLVCTSSLLAMYNTCPRVYQPHMNYVTDYQLYINDFIHFFSDFRVVLHKTFIIILLIFYEEFFFVKG
jgi:hypothetical protein